MAEDFIAQMREIMAQVEQDEREQAPRTQARLNQIADAARAGDLGTDWRRTQQRVDRGETTLQDVFAGRDDSPEGAALSARARESARSIAADVHEGGAGALTWDLEALDAARIRLALLLQRIDADEVESSRPPDRR